MRSYKPDIIIAAMATPLIAGLVFVVKSTGAEPTLVLLGLMAIIVAMAFASSHFAHRNDPK